VGVDALGDPVPSWAREYADTLHQMGNRGVAIGTDINGLAPQVPFTRVDVPETNTVASSRAPASLAASAPPLATDRFGTTALRVEDRGIAHYGMLPDFLAAVAAQPEGTEAMTGLFRSAEDFLVMWDKVQLARNRVLTALDATPVQQLRVTVTTGDDDLRCDSTALAFVSLQGEDKVPVSLGSSLGGGSVVTREFSLPAPHPMSDLASFGLEANLSNGDFSPCAGLSPDNWSVAGAKLEFRDSGGQWRTIIHRRGRWLKRMDHGAGNQEWVEPL
jgi:hypothetical protein